MSNQPTYRLHGALQSSNTRRAALTFEHLAVPYELVPINLRDPADRVRLVALNPNSKIPVLVHGDFVLWESHAIMQYVATQVPGQTIYPIDPRVRADVDRWLFWLAAHFAPPLGGLGWERIWKALVTGQPADPDQVARHEQAFHTVAKIADAHLSSRAYFVGDAVSLADLSLAATVANAAMYKAPLDPYPNVRRLHDRIAKLPAWVATQPK
jgi:glutathione S-transferase